MVNILKISFQEIRRRSRDKNITSQDLTHHLLFHNLKEKKLRPADENSIENKERTRRHVGNTDYFMSDEGEDKYLSDQGESEFDEELVSFSNNYT